MPAMRDRAPSTAERLRALVRRVAELERRVLPLRARDRACTCRFYYDGRLCPTCTAWSRHRIEVDSRVLSGKYK